MVPVTRFAPLSDLLVLLWGDPVERSVWVPVFEDVPLHIPFLPSIDKTLGPQFEGVLVVGI
jgi:hypothetical protein